MFIIDLLKWIASYWSILIWAVPIGIGSLFLGRNFGWKFATPAFALGLLLVVFKLGRKTERDNYRKRVQDIKENREKAYDKIDDRGTDRDDVLDRLSDGSF